jgi:hypothetical protein
MGHKILESIIAKMDTATKEAWRLRVNRPNTIFIAYGLYERLVDEFNRHYVTGNTRQYVCNIAGAEVVASDIVTDEAGVVHDDIYELCHLPDFQRLAESRPFNDPRHEARA